MLRCSTIMVLSLSLTGRAVMSQAVEGQPSEGASPLGASSQSSHQDARMNDAQIAVAPLPPTVPAGRPAVGLALEGGGALGLAHIGILKWFEENHIPVDRIAGTSMGALIGALYATGNSPAEIEKLASASDFTTVFAFEKPYTDLSYRRRQDRRELPQ